MPPTNDATNFILTALKGVMATPNQCFTAYDITKIARSLTKERINHEDVRQIIHNLYEQGFMGGYNRVTHTFQVANSGQTSDGTTTAQLFVPSGSDQYSYDPNSVAMSIPNYGAPTVNSVDDDDDDYDDYDDYDDDYDDEDYDDDDYDDHDDCEDEDYDDDEEICDTCEEKKTQAEPGLVENTSNPLPANHLIFKASIQQANQGNPVTLTPAMPPIPPLSSPAVSTTKLATNEEQESYLNRWNKPELRTAEQSLLERIKAKITTTLKDLF